MIRSIYDAPAAAGIGFPTLVLCEHFLHVFAQRGLAFAAAVEHVTAGIDDELDPLCRERRQLVEHPLRSEIGRGEIEQAVRDQHVQLGVGGKDLA